MKSMLLREITSLESNPEPLVFTDIPEPNIGENEILIKVSRCGVCHTELDEIEGRTPPPQLPVVLGHQVVGTVLESNSLLSSLQEQAPVIQIGSRVGVAWIGSACGKCNYCTSGMENLCPEFKATGRDIDGGYAEYMKIRADFVHPIPDSLTDSEAAPLLCAGAIGFRSLSLSNLQDGDSLGLMGFGGSNHLVLKLAKYKYPNSDIYVFTRNPEEREFALSLGATWAGAIDQNPPEGLDAVIDTTPVWGPDVEALKYLKPGGRLVINAIRKEEKDKDVLLKLDYPTQLWMEKEIKSVANVTREDVRQFLKIAADANIRPEYQEYGLQDATRALVEMKKGKIRGAKVLCV